MADLDMAGPVPGTTQLSSAGDWESFFLPLRADGFESGMDPSLDAGGRNIVLGPGRAFLRAYVAVITADSNATTIPAASSQDRVDRLVLRLNRAATTEATWIVPHVIEGTPAASPQPPAPVRTDDGLWDLPVCRWTSKANGSLAGLVNERTFLAGPVQSLPATTPYPPASRQLGVTADGRVLASGNGSDWDTVVYSDSGWQSLSTNGPDAAAWNLDGVNRIRALSGVVQVQFTLQRAGKTDMGTGDSDGSSPIRVSSAFRPSQPVPLSVFGNAFAAPRIPMAGRVNTDGTVQLFATTTSLAVGRVAQGAGTWLLG